MYFELSFTKYVVRMMLACAMGFTVGFVVAREDWASRRALQDVKPSLRKESEGA